MSSVEELRQRQRQRQHRAGKRKKKCTVRSAKCDDTRRSHITQNDIKRPRGNTAARTPTSATKHRCASRKSTQEPCKAERSTIKHLYRYEYPKTKKVPLRKHTRVAKHSAVSPGAHGVFVDCGSISHPIGGSLRQ